MTQTATQVTTGHPPDLFAILTDLVTNLLAPMFLGVCNGDINLARRAATETVSTYRARNNADPLAVAQIIGFGLAALGSLNASMADDITLSMALRLRGNANACNRSAEQNRRAIQPAPITEPPPPEPPSPATEIFLHADAEQLLAVESQTRLDQPAGEPPATARTSPEKRNQQMWAIAMAKAASEINASLPDLPPGQRKDAAMRAGLLGSTAHDLIYGASAQPPEPDQTPPPA